MINIDKSRGILVDNPLYKLLSEALKRLSDNIFF